jgi:hypothetical protein
MGVIPGPRGRGEVCTAKTASAKENDEQGPHPGGHLLGVF